MKISDNPIGSAATWYREHGPSPLVTSLLLAAGVYGFGRLAWGPFVETARSLGRPIGSRMLGEGKEGKEQWNLAMDNLKERSDLRYKVPLMIAAASLIPSLYFMASPAREKLGLLDWNAPQSPDFVQDYLDVPKGEPEIAKPLSKSSSFVEDSYVGNIDWNRKVNSGMAVGLFNKDPFLAESDYTRHMGTAIINNAALQNHTSSPTLGNIFDSAVSKIENKMTFEGVAKVGLKTAVANTAARLFTGALGAVCDLSPAAQQTLVDAGTWAGAMKAILE